MKEKKREMEERNLANNWLHIIVKWEKERERGREREGKREKGRERYRKR